MSIAAQPLAGSFVAESTHSSFQFAVKHMKVATYRATFDDVSATVTGGEDGVQLDGAARVASITIRDQHFRDHVVDGADFFDAGNHPEIRFRSTRVELSDDGAATVDGELTIRGVTHPVKAAGNYEPPVDDPFGNTRAAIQLTAVVDRREWGMDWQAPLPKGGDVLGWDVELTVVLALVKQDGDAA